MVLHACLVGPKVSSDTQLADLLRIRHRITSVARVDELLKNPLLGSVDVLVIECTDQIEACLEFLAPLKRKIPDLIVILVDGGLSQSQLARAFRDGATDYFKVPYDVSLLAERVDRLSARLKRRNDLHHCNGQS